MTRAELLADLDAIIAALSPLPEDPSRGCIGCPPIVNALDLLETLRRKILLLERSTTDRR